jgi:hypothetical protein
VEIAGIWFGDHLICTPSFMHPYIDTRKFKAGLYEKQREMPYPYVGGDLHRRLVHSDAQF